MSIETYALGQSVLNVALVVCILKLKRRVDAVESDSQSSANELYGIYLDQCRNIADLEAAERARKELPK